MATIRRFKEILINAGSIFLLALVFAVVLVVSYRALMQIDVDEALVIHSYQVSTNVTKLMSDLENLETGARGYIVTGQDNFLEPYNNYLPDVNVRFALLQELVKGNKDEEQKLTLLKPLIDMRLVQLRDIIVLRKDKGIDGAMTVVIAGKQTMDSIRAIVEDLDSYVAALLQERTQDLVRVNRAAESIIIWGAVIGLLVYLLVNYIVSRFVMGNLVEKPLLESARKATEEAVRANKEMEAFSYSVSHDLRAPLRAIDGFTQILVEQYNEKLDDEGRRISSVIRASTVQMGKLIDDLLSFSRLGRQEIKKGQVDMNVLVGEVYAEAKKIVPEKTIKFIVNNLSVANADVNMMRVVWTNLISNAIKFTGKKGDAMIEVGSKDDVENVTYYIKDNGAGFDMKYINKLFGVFQRLHSADEFEGTGVGLANVKRVVERHGGRIWAEAEIGMGATFYFTLPKYKS